MDKPDLTPEAGYAALQAHVAERAHMARARYGPDIDLVKMLAILEDREIVRFPTELRFDAEVLQPGEFGWPQPLGDKPSDGFALVIHPHFRQREEDLPLLIAYQLVAINYLDLANADEAEIFASTLLGIDREEYYSRICQLADGIPR